MRWGLGPVFVYECLAGSRRWQTYALRSFAVVALLVGMAAIAFYDARKAGPPGTRWQQYAQLGESYFYAMIGVELALVLLAAPAATAGAICHDRARGTLDHVLATDLSDAEIVLGKLAARMLPVLGLVACSWPVLAISSLLGGIDPSALTWAFAIILAVALLGCALALALSVWARKPHEVVLAVYLFWIAMMLIWPIWMGLAVGKMTSLPPAWTLAANPFYLAFAPYAVPGRVGITDYLEFFSATLGGSFLLTALAVWKMRPVASHGPSAPSKKSKLGWLGRLTRRLPGPSLDGNPVLWREWHRSRPSRWMTGILFLVGGLTMIASGIGACSAWMYGVGPRGGAQVGLDVGASGSTLQLLIGLLMLSAIAPLAMTEERQRGSLDLLAVTALSSRSIVLGKWLGTVRLVPLLWIGPGLMALALATGRKVPFPWPPGLAPSYYQELSHGERCYSAALVFMTILAHGALIASFGLALACWVRRQGRAVGLCVGGFVFLTIGWPVLVSVVGNGPNRGLAMLSPLMATVEQYDVLNVRTKARLGGSSLWAMFGDVEAAVLAAGLLWMTLRTADRALGRVPDRPRQTPVLSDVIVVLAAMLGAGCLFGAIIAWTNGVSPWSGPGRDLEVMTIGLSTSIGLLLAAVHAGRSIASEFSECSPAIQAAPTVSARRLLWRHWWKSCLLVLLLAIGPGLLSLAQATAYRIPMVLHHRINLSSGGASEIQTQLHTGITIVSTFDANGKPLGTRLATLEEIQIAGGFLWVHPSNECLAVGVASATLLLAQGAFFVSLALALGAWLGSRRAATIYLVCLFSVIAIGWPIYYSTVMGGGGSGFLILSPLMAPVLLVPIDPSLSVLDFARAAAFGHAAGAFALFWLAVRGAKRARGGALSARKTAPPAARSELERTDVDPAPSLVES